MQLTDTHCHIHEAVQGQSGNNLVYGMWQKSKNPDPESILANARKDGVNRLICVGTTLADSKLAIDFVADRAGTWASIGIHPHESEDHNSTDHLEQFEELATKPKVVAVGECGLDYYYDHSPKKHQQELLEFQLELAKKHDLPLIFHVRDAFDDFFAILSHFEGVRGVVHSFTANTTVLDKCLNRGLYIGLNGIMTFTKDQAQLDAAKVVPLQKLLLETDAPFLTPKPFRGTICEPKHVLVTAEFLANLRGESLEELATATSQNAANLFNLS